MKFYIRTIENGKRLSLQAVEGKRIAAKEKILAAGNQYLETEGMLGSFDALARRIEEKVYVIEDIQAGSYV